LRNSPNLTAMTRSLVGIGLGKDPDCLSERRACNQRCQHNRLKGTPGHMYPFKRVGLDTLSSQLRPQGKMETRRWNSRELRGFRRLDPRNSAAHRIFL
jgi:hypothetical protein